MARALAPGASRVPCFGLLVWASPRCFGVRWAMDTIKQSDRSGAAVRLLDRAPLLDGHRVLGASVLLDCIGTGGMGAVFRAWHLDHGVEVAVKVLHPVLAVEPLYVQRFRREARLAMRITHPAIVRVFEVGHEAGLHFIVMEFVAGETLPERVARSGPLDASQATAVLVSLAAGLAEAHAQGIVHRDVKPENVLVSLDGRVRLTDLGLARHAVDEVGRTLVGETAVVLGTPQYMPPEQWDSPLVKAPSDVWAIGATLHFASTGRHAVPGGPPGRTARWIYEHELPDLPAEGALAHVYRRCVCRDARQRYQDAGELLDDLRRLGLVALGPGACPTVAVADTVERRAPVPTAAQRVRLQRLVARARRRAGRGRRLVGWRAHAVWAAVVAMVAVGAVLSSSSSSSAAAATRDASGPALARVVEAEPSARSLRDERAALRRLLATGVQWRPGASVLHDGLAGAWGVLVVEPPLPPHVSLSVRLVSSTLRRESVPMPLVHAGTHAVPVRGRGAQLVVVRAEGPFGVAVETCVAQVVVPSWTARSALAACVAPDPPVPSSAANASPQGRTGEPPPVVAHRVSERAGESRVKGPPQGVPESVPQGLPLAGLRPAPTMWPFAHAGPKAVDEPAVDGASHEGPLAAADRDFAAAVRTGRRGEIVAAARRLVALDADEPAHALALAVALVSLGGDEQLEAGRLLRDYADRRAQLSPAALVPHAARLERLGLHAAFAERDLRAADVGDWLVGQRLRAAVASELRFALPDADALARRRQHLQRGADRVADNAAELEGLRAEHEAARDEHRARQLRATSRSDRANWRRLASRNEKAIERYRQQLESKQRMLDDYRDECAALDRAEARMRAFRLR